MTLPAEALRDVARKDSGEGIVMVDGRGAPLFENATASRLLQSSWTAVDGETRLQVEGLFRPDMSTSLPPEEFPLARALEGETVEDAEIFVRNVNHPDGVWLTADARPLAEGGAVLILRDRTALKQAEEAVAHLAAVLDAVNDAVLTTTLEGTILWANGAAKVLLGDSLGGDVTRYDLPGLCRADDARKVQDEVIPTAVEEGSWNGEVEWRAAAGRTVQVCLTVRTQRDDAGEPIFLAVVARDVTAKRRAEESVRLLTAALADALDGVSFVDARGKLQYVNEAFEEMVGSRGRKVLGSSWIRLIHPKDRKKVKACHERMVRDGRGQSEIRSVRPDGSTSHLEVVMTPAIDSRDRLKGFYLFTQDITDRKRAEEELKTAKVELDARARDLARSNAELEQFAYVASHDLQEPLRMVSSFTQLLADRYGDRLDGEAHEFISFALDGVTRMRQLIQDLLEYSRVERHGAEFAPVDLNEIHADVLANLHEAIKESGARLPRSNLPTLHGDAGQLSRLLQNLVGNAIKFRGEATPEVAVEAERCGKEWVISVRDNGIGIDPNHVDRIFEIFQRLHTHEEYPGTGIGLAIAKKIVERHGGRIWVERNRGGGSIFFLTLPAEPNP